MSRVKNRNRLKKYLGTSQKFEATYSEINHEHSKILVVNLTLQGSTKLLADHVWVQLPNDRLHYPDGCKLEFGATVISYSDSHGVFKYGVANVHALREVTKQRVLAKEKNTHDNKYANMRRNKKRK